MGSFFRPHTVGVAIAGLEILFLRPFLSFRKSEISTKVRSFVGSDICLHLYGIDSLVSFSFRKDDIPSISKLRSALYGSE